MEIIKQIEIKNFRSFGNRKKESYKVIKCNDLNIISGANDSGKSNILRALNLFFNGHTSLNQFFDFERDFYSKLEPDELDIKEELVTIKIWFYNKKNKDKNKNFPSKIYIPEEFWVAKKWKKTSTYSSNDIATSIKKDFEIEKGEYFNNFLKDQNESNTILKSNVNASLQKQLTDFLNSIQFHYVPAIKGKDYFSHLFGELQKTLWKAKKSIVETKKVDFEKSIQNETNKLMSEFKHSVKASGDINFNPVFELPSDLINLFRALVVQTGNVDLTLRGDGLQAKLIPEILNFISIKELELTLASVKSGEKPKKFFIWGFEEPENSYEYKNAQLLAEKFKQIFIQNAQIFITTHSFNFISLESDNISKYRVWQDLKVSNSKISKIKTDYKGRLKFEGNDFKSDWKKLEEELGFFHLNSELKEIYKRQEDDLLLIKNKLSSIDKPIVYTEGNNVSYIKKAKDFFSPNIDFDIKNLGGKTEIKKFFLQLSKTNYNRHKMFFVFDCDANSEYTACNNVRTSVLNPYVFKMNTNNKIEELQIGIENLFSEDLFEEENLRFSITETKRDGNILSRTRKLRKPEFETFIMERDNEDDFENFKHLINFLKDKIGT
jgi:AAA15 family ATPase/GTPase